MSVTLTHITRCLLASLNRCYSISCLNTKLSHNSSAKPVKPVYYSTNRPVASTVDGNEVDSFRRLSDKWWSEGGAFDALHAMNNLRIPLIIDSRPVTAPKDSVSADAPLSGCRILDVGCGGGILSEPLARLGASVTGLDVVEENIAAAEEHRLLSQDPLLERNLRYECSTIEDFVCGREETYDMVVMSEVIEHVASPDTFMKACSELTKTKGSLVLTTINRTSTSYLFGIILAEYLMNLVPRGTHDWDKFITPDELRDLAEKYGCCQQMLIGMFYQTASWSWTKNTNISYASTFVKS